MDRNSCKIRAAVDVAHAKGDAGADIETAGQSNFPATSWRYPVDNLLTVKVMQITVLPDHLMDGPRKNGVNVWAVNNRQLKVLGHLLPNALNSL